MSGSEHSAAFAFADQPELSIRGLLDHIAAELAHGYVRLMEAAADAETKPGNAEPREDR
jgi:hypothetical protein